MKTLKILTFVVFASILTVGCKKYLETDPMYSQDAENYFTEEEHYHTALVGAYDLLQGSFINIWIGEIASDNSIAGGESVVDSKGLHDIDEMNHGGVNIELRNVLRWNYAGVTRANYIMENKDNVSFSGKTQLLAEARFLRAYYYFQLVKYFGDIPLIVDERLGIDELKEKERTPKSEVYAQIESDLSFASENLPAIATIKGKATSGAAKSLLGRVYLYQRKFSECASVLDEVINSGQYDLAADYTTLFAENSEGNSETVFDVQYSGLEGGSYGCLICLEGNAAPGFQGIRQYTGPIYGDGNSYNLPTKDLYEAFDVNDKVRRDASVLDIEAFIALQSETDITYAIGGGGHTGYYNNKYIKRIGEFGLPDNDLTSPVNYRVIRFADVLLMAAEAYSEIGNSGRSLEYVNKVRSRAGAPALSSSGEELLSDIYQERRLELCGEGFRFFDLVRTGEAENKIEGFISGKHDLFPIPQVEIALAGSKWSQNTGY
ncbi:MAG: RagB/SusD family nutrient uptake outer membrane protein [Crocinitomicaceae bacterium]|nr:RagB/SusD family nutrient uptake outer membrane protein [Crocinitomicaceae bacterium]|tara:strand:+ start:27822 stop:29291 length:1470 start_codon:yes stop_codon:yes gene_type:complete